MRLYQELKDGHNLYPLPFQTFILSGDQTAQQTILHEWQNGYHDGAVTGENTWILKWPLYVVTNNLPLNSMQRQFITSEIILASVAAGLLGLLAYMTFLVTRSKEKMLFVSCIVAGLLIVIPAYMFEYLSWPNSRNIELVGFLWLLILPLKYELDTRSVQKSKKGYYLVSTVIATLLFVDDPLFMYLTIPLMAVLLVVRYLVGIEKQLSNLYKPLLYGAVAAIGSIIIRLILVFLTPLETIMRVPATLNAQGIQASVGTFISGTLSLLGVNSPKSGRTSIDLLFVGLYALILVGSMLGIALWYKKKPRSFFAQFLLFFGVWNLALFIVRGADASGDPAGNRYMMALYVCQLVGTVLLISFFRLRRQFVALTVTVGALILLVFAMLIVKPYKMAATQYATRMDGIHRIVKLLEGNGLDKGYTRGGMEPFKFISGYKINPITGVCMKQSDGSGKLYFFDLLSEVSIKNDYKSSKSYFLSLDAARDNCTPELLTYQFGEPQQTLQLWSAVSGTYTISIYDYDISSRIPIQKM